MDPSACDVAVPTCALPPAIPFTCSVTPVWFVPVTFSPNFKVLATRTSVPSPGCSVNTTCPGPTTTGTVAELADPGSGLLTKMGKVPGLGAGIAAANWVPESMVVGTGAPFHRICAPYTNCDPETVTVVVPSEKPEGVTVLRTGIGFQMASVTDPGG